MNICFDRYNILVIYGLAAVSRDPSPLPMMKMQAQNPPKLSPLMAGIASRAPIPAIKDLDQQQASVSIDFQWLTIKTQPPNEDRSIPKVT